MIKCRTWSDYFSHFWFLCWSKWKTSGKNPNFQACFIVTIRHFKLDWKTTMLTDFSIFILMNPNIQSGKIWWFDEPINPNKIWKDLISQFSPILRFSHIFPCGGFTGLRDGCFTRVADRSERSTDAVSGCRGPIEKGVRKMAEMLGNVGNKVSRVPSFSPMIWYHPHSFHPRHFVPEGAPACVHPFDAGNETWLH